jgi:sulfite oxidase
MSQDPLSKEVPIVKFHMNTPNRSTMETRTKYTKPINNRPDEWMIEQGLAAHKLPIIDQSGKSVFFVAPPAETPVTINEKAIRAIGDRSKLFAREKPGWIGYGFPYGDNL